MVPFVREIVPVGDVENNRILISTPVGLLDLTSVKAMKGGPCTRAFVATTGQVPLCQFFPWLLLPQPLPDELKASKLEEAEEREASEKNRRLSMPPRPVRSQPAAESSSSLEVDEEEEVKEKTVRPAARRRIARPTSRKLRIG